MRWLTAVVVCAGLSALPCSSSAKGAKGAKGGQQAVAEALFQKGLAAMERKDFDAACSAFDESARIDPAPGTIYNLADCEASRGHYASSWQWFSQVTEKLPENDERRPVVEQRINALKAHLGFLTVRLGPMAPPETTVSLDATALGAASLGFALPVDPGTHHIVVSAEGRAPKELDFPIHEGEQRELLVEPGPAPGSAEPVAAPPLPAPAPPQPLEPAPAPVHSGHGTRDIGYVVGGVGVVGVTTALVLGGIALGKKATVDNHCTASAGTCNSQEGIDASSSGKTLTTVSTVSFIVGAAALGAGIYLVVSSKDHAPQTALSVTPTAGGASLGWVRAF
jgi:hypothetical protein